MYTDFYEKMSAPWRHTKDGQEKIQQLDTVLRYLVAGAYGLLIIMLVMNKDERLLRAVMVPLLCFLFVSVLRLMINADRPYEAYPIKPLIFKDAHGQSMPSRHMTSASIIALTFLWINPLWGIVALAVAALIGYVRIAGGVHFPRDIAVGAGLALLFAALGFVFIP